MQDKDCITARAIFFCFKTLRVIRPLFWYYIVLQLYYIKNAKTRGGQAFYYPRKIWGYCKTLYKTYGHIRTFKPRFLLPGFIFVITWGPVFFGVAPSHTGLCNDARPLTFTIILHNLILCRILKTNKKGCI